MAKTIKRVGTKFATYLKGIPQLPPTVYIPLGNKNHGEWFRKPLFFDFSIAKTQEWLRDMRDSLDANDEPYCDYASLDTALQNNCRLQSLIERAEATTVFGKDWVIATTGWRENWAIHNGVVYAHNGDFEETLDILRDRTGFQNKTPAAVILPYKVMPKQKESKKKKKMLGKSKLTFLVNGDDVDASYGPDIDLNEVDDIGTFRFPTISFECLRQFYGEDALTRDVARRIAEGEIKIVDYLSDHWITLSMKQYNKLEKCHGNGKLTLKSPGAGYTIVGRHSWHRPATVLMYDEANKMSLLFGVDEDSYFGVELPDNPKTVEKAFESLIPSECRNVDGVHRQGEWFAKSITSEQLPPITDCVVTMARMDASNSDGPVNRHNITLHRDKPGSARHILSAVEAYVKGSVVYALDPVLEHERAEHEDLNLTGWYAFYRNTAIRSFSVQGVD